MGPVQDLMLADLLPSNRVMCVDYFFVMTIVFCTYQSAPPCTDLKEEYTVTVSMLNNVKAVLLFVCYG